jgi:hypothetical protein
MTPEAATPKELERAAITISVADFEERVANTRDLWETDSMYEDILETLEQEPGGKLFYYGIYNSPCWGRRRKNIEEMKTDLANRRAWQLHARRSKSPASRAARIRTRGIRPAHYRFRPLHSA